MIMIPFVPDNLNPADLPEEPEGFWDDLREQISRWVEEYGDETA